jgi:hypothetical protein
MPGSDALGIKAGHASIPETRQGESCRAPALPVWILVYLLTLLLKQGEALDRHEPRETDQKTWQGFSVLTLQMIN